MQLSPAQEQLAEAHFEVFKLNGFNLVHDYSRPPGRRIRITALPTCQGLVFGEKDVHDLLYNLEEVERGEPDGNASSLPGHSGLLDLTGHRGLGSATALPRPRKVWQLLACRACRGATMIGTALRVNEMKRILDNLSSLEQPWNCPHGRPTVRHLIDTPAVRSTSSLMPPLANLLSMPPR